MLIPSIQLLLKNISVHGIARRVGIFLIIILPFQGLPQTLYYGGAHKGRDIPSFLKAINYLDEISFFLFAFIFFALVCIRPDLHRIKKLPFLLNIFCFLLVGIVGMAVNRISIEQGGFEIYNLIKNILISCIFAWISFNEKDLKITIKMLKYIALLMFFFAVVGEIGAIMAGKWINILVTSDKRFGFYRVISMTGFGNWNYLGIYVILIFYLLYVNRNKQVSDYFVMSSIGIIIILTFSRQAWFCFILLFYLLNRSRITAVALIGIIIFLSVISLTSLGQTVIPSGMIQSFDPEHFYRLYAFLQSINLFLDNPVFGKGPGMIGGLSSILFNSPVYEDWPRYFRDFTYEIGGIDQFWPGVLADLGLVGFVTYGLIFIGFYRYLHAGERFFLTIKRTDLAGIGRMLRYYLFVLVLMGFAGGLNKAFVVYTYFALSGMFFSIYMYHNQKQNSQLLPSHIIERAGDEGNAAGER